MSSSLSKSCVECRTPRKSQEQHHGWTGAVQQVLATARVFRPKRHEACRLAPNGTHNRYQDQKTHHMRIELHVLLGCLARKRFTHPTLGHNSRGVQTGRALELDGRPQHIYCTVMIECVVDDRCHCLFSRKKRWDALEAHQEKADRAMHCACPFSDRPMIQGMGQCRN